MLIDSHIHLDHLADEDLAAITEQALTGAYRALVPGIAPVQWASSMARLGALSWVDLAMGLHPWESSNAPDGWLDALETWLSGEQGGRVRAIGEIGLDHLRHTTDADRDRAEAVFEAQLGLAARWGRPVIVHCVRAHERAQAVVRRVQRSSAGGASLRGVVHAFSSSMEVYEGWHRLGFVVGMGSMVTDPRATRARKIATSSRVEDLLLETDAPFMQVFRERAGDRTQGSGGGIVDVARAVASLRGMDVETIEALTSENYFRIFGS